MSLNFAWILCVWRYALAHIFISIVVLAAVFGGGWYVLSQVTAASAEARYVLGQVERSSVAASISASGQISASNEVDLKPGASSKVTYVGVKAGQEVRAGQLLVRLDAGDAADELETAQLKYEELIAIDPADLRDAQSGVTQAMEDLESSYVSARAALTVASTDLSDVMVELDELYRAGGYLSTQKSSLSDTEREYRDRARDAWYDATQLLDALVESFSAVPLDAPRGQIDALVAQSYEAASAVARAAKYAQDAVVFLRNRDEGGTADADAAYASAVEQASAANDTVSALSSSKDSVVGSKRELIKAQDALADIQDGPSTYDRRSQALQVAQKQKALADYSVYAPFAGIIATVDAQVGDTVGSSNAVATLITRSQVAEVSLNEVDAAKVKAGQKATLTFDALEELALTGTVVAVDAVGAVDQGVVSYGVEIALDAQDSRIKPGMTVNASIQTDVAQDVLVAPASAVKTAQGQTYVLVFDPAIDKETAAASGPQGVTSATAPVRVPVEVGIEGDTNVEIVSGLDEGQQIVTRTISATSAAASSAGGTTGTSAGGVGGTMPAGAVMRAF